MQFKRILKSSYSVRIRPRQQNLIDFESRAYLEELKEASPVKKYDADGEIAIIPNELGKHEKFSDKHKIMEILQRLNYIKNISSPKLLPKRIEPTKKCERTITPSTSYHHLYRKIHTPYSPGVVRIQSQEKLANLSRSSSKSFLARKFIQEKQIKNASKIEIIKQESCKSYTSSKKSENSEIQFDNND